MRILTIGHSNRALDELLAMLAAHGAEQLIDVRTIPKSRHNPQFNIENLSAAFPYEHLPKLGGRRHPRKDSRNSAWKNDSFRGYADYMETADFESALEVLIERAGERQVCIMCAESVPWRCHRSLIADALTGRGIEVAHIMTQTSAKPHTLTPFARVENGRVSYPGVVEFQPQ